MTTTTITKTSGTVNRGWLKRRILAGEVEARRNYRYTDDYAYDAAVDFGKTDWIPAHVVGPDESQYRDGLADHMNFADSDFRGYGHAWWNADGTITLYFGYESFELRLK